MSSRKPSKSRRCERGERFARQLRAVPDHHEPSMSRDAAGRGRPGKSVLDCSSDGSRARGPSPTPSAGSASATRARPSATRCSRRSPASRSSRSTRPRTSPERRAHRLPGRVPVHARRLPVDVPRPALDDAPVRRASARPRRRTSASATCSTTARPGLSTAFDMPSLMGHDSDHPRSRGRGRPRGRGVDSLDDMETLFGGIPTWARCRRR